MAKRLGVTKIVTSEHAEQRALVARLAYSGIVALAIPNAARRSPRAAAYLKAEGMRAGSPDLILVQLAPSTGRPVAVELKRVEGGRVSESQAAMHEALRYAGWHVVVARGCDDALAQLAAAGFRVAR